MGCWTEFKQVKNYVFANTYLDFPGGAGGREPAFQCRSYRYVDSIPGLGRSPGREHGNALQYSCLEIPMDRGTWKALVHGDAKTQT